MILFFNLPRQGPKLTLKGIDPLDQIGQGIARDRRLGRLNLRANLRFYRLGTTGGKDATLNSAKLLLEPFNPAVDALGALCCNRSRDSRQQGEAKKMETHDYPQTRIRCPSYCRLAPV